MIVGIGTDVLQINRIEKILEKYRDSFINRILNESEIIKLYKLNPNKHASFIAKRFAAKESVSKALGTGIGKGITFKDIVISNDESGKPFVTLDGYQHKYNIHLSLSDDYPVATAFCIVSTKK